MMIFTAPGVRAPGPYTECFACGAWKRDHGPDGACPVSDSAPHGIPAERRDEEGRHG